MRSDVCGCECGVCVCERVRECVSVCVSVTTDNAACDINLRDRQEKVQTLCVFA